MSGRSSRNATRNPNQKQRDGKKHLTRPGLEPGISGSGGRRLIHWANGPSTDTLGKRGIQNTSRNQDSRFVQMLVVCIIDYCHIKDDISTGLVAQWIRHRPTEPGIAGSSPAEVILQKPVSHFHALPDFTVVCLGSLCNVSGPCQPMLRLRWRFPMRIELQSAVCTSQLRNAIAFRILAKRNSFEKPRTKQGSRFEVRGEVLSF